MKVKISIPYINNQNVKRQSLWIKDGKEALTTGGEIYNAYGKTDEEIEMLLDHFPGRMRSDNKLEIIRNFDVKINFQVPGKEEVYMEIETNVENFYDDVVPYLREHVGY